MDSFSRATHWKKSSVYQQISVVSSSSVCDFMISIHTEIMACLVLYSFLCIQSQLLWIHMWNGAIMSGRYLFIFISCFHNIFEALGRGWAFHSLLITAHLPVLDLSIHHCLLPKEASLTEGWEMDIKQRTVRGSLLSLCPFIKIILIGVQLGPITYPSKKFGPI